MLTTDLSLRFDPAYEKISRRFHENPQEFARRLRQGVVQADAPRHGSDRALPRPGGSHGAAVVAGPGPAGDSRTDRTRRTSPLSRSKILASGLSVSQLVSTAWASASTFRGTDKRGGANGARIRLAPQKDWAVNNPPELAKVLKTLEGIQKAFNDAQAGGKKQVSLADVIVLGGCAAVEKAAKDAGYDVQVPFTPGRTDASQEQTDVESFAVLEPDADGFRNYLGRRTRGAGRASARRAGVQADADRARDDRARRRPACPQREHGAVERRRVHQAARHVDQRLLREPARHGHGVEADVRSRGDVRGPRSREEATSSGPAAASICVFGSNSELRALAEVYACDDAKEKFVRDFVAAWDKVMNLDRFDLA